MLQHFDLGLFSTRRLSVVCINLFRSLSHGVKVPLRSLARHLFYSRCKARRLFAVYRAGICSIVRPSYYCNTEQGLIFPLFPYGFLMQREKGLNLRRSLFYTAFSTFSLRSRKKSYRFSSAGSYKRNRLTFSYTNVLPHKQKCPTLEFIC